MRCNVHIGESVLQKKTGVGLLPEPTLRREVEAGTLRAVRMRGCRLMRPLGIIHRRHHGLGDAARDFVDLLRGSASANGRQHRNGHSSAV